MGRFKMEQTLPKPQNDLVSYDEDKRPSDTEAVITSTVRGDYDAGRDSLVRQYRQQRDETRAVNQMLADGPANTAFYLVYGKGGVLPASNRDKADRLARGLAKTNPGCTYLILEAIGAVRVPVPDIEDVPLNEAISVLESRG